MSRYSQEIHNILRNADSKRVADKKKCVLKLLELYDNKDAIKEINENSKQDTPGQVNWTLIVHSVHRILLSEADRIAVKGDSSRLSADRRNTCALVSTTVRNANSSEGIHLKCSDLTSLLLQVLSSKLYANYHDTYMTVFVRHVLPVRQYRADMLSGHWKELLRVCIALYKDPSPNVKKAVVLDAIHGVIQHGCLQSDLILDAKKILPFLVTVFADISQETLAKSIYKVANSLCRQIGTESRIALCEFSEAILPNVISLSASREKYDLLLLMVQIHHPKGALMGHGAAYACDWNKWKMILESMYSTILSNCKAEVLTDSLVELASEVFRQVMADDAVSPVNVMSSYERPYSLPSKRRRVSMDAAVVSDPERAWPAIQILTATIKKYPDSLKRNDFVPFLRIVTEFFTSTCKEEKVMDSVCQLGKVLVELEGSRPDDFVKNEDTRVYWDQIWDVTLRFLGVRHNEVSGHRLLRSLIRHKGASNPRALVRLYVTKAIGWSASSLRTLIAFCEDATLPDYVVPIDGKTTNVKMALLGWALDVPNVSAGIPIEDLCRLLIGLTLKTRGKGDGTRRGNASSCAESADSAAHYDDESDLSLRDANATNRRNIERCHLSIEFETELFDETDAKAVVEGNASASHAEDAVEFLIEGLCELAVRYTGTASENIDSLIVRAALVAKVASSMKESNMIRGNVRDFCLVNVTRDALRTVCALLGDDDVPTSRYKCTYLVSITRALSELYRISYDDEIAQVIVSSTTVGALRGVLSLTGAKIATESAVRLAAFGALTSFCCKIHGVVASDVQRNLSRTLAKSNRYELASATDFAMATTFLEAWGGCRSQLACETIESRVRLLMDLCRHWYRDEFAARRILNLLPGYLEHVDRAGNDVQRYNLIQILTSFHKLICDGNYGPLVSVEFVRCLGKVARLNPSLTWRRRDANSDASADSPIVEELLTYVNDPFYVVRLEAVRCLHAIFSSSLVNFQWLSTFFRELRQVATTSLFVVDGDLGERERTDERATRVATALHAFATIICSNGMFQEQALFALLRLTVDKETSVEVVRKVARVIAATKRTHDPCRLVEDNLNYLLTHWLDSPYPLDAFPWALTRCASRDEFYASCICTLVPIKLRRGESTDAMTLCDSLGLSFVETIESCYPSIVSWLLPHVSADPSGKPISTIESAADTGCAVEIYERLKSSQGEFRSVRDMSELLADNLAEVVVRLVQRLHDEEHFGRLFESSTTMLPASDPPHFTSEAVDRSLERLTDDLTATSGRSLVRYLASERRDALQAILSKLARVIHESTYVRRRSKALHQYAYFCATVIRELHREHLDAMSTYVVREIGYTLLHLIEANADESISEMGCRCLVLLSKGALPTRHEQVEELLSFAVAVLTPIVRAARTTTVAVQLLRYLIVDQREILSDAIGRLDPFPSDPIFEEMSEVHRSLRYKHGVARSLDDEIRHFLNAGTCRSVDGLACLRHQLSARRAELGSMYDRLETLRGFAEDCVTSTPHRLIHRLVELMASAEAAVSLEAAKCLGEIGPADLTTMILQPATSHAKETTDHLETLLYMATTLLSDHLIDRDVALRAASADALHAILGSTWGRKLADKSYLELFAPYAWIEPLRLDRVRPFLATGRAPIVVDRVKFKDRLDPNDAIWTATSNVSHVDWVTRVACIIVRGFANDACLGSLVPVCRLSPRFCESLLPRLVHLIIRNADGESRTTDDACRCIDRFFDCHFRCVVETDKSSRGSITCLNRESVSCMLNVVNVIRLQSDNDALPALNYLHVAKAAQYCSAYFTSVLYAELWCEAPLKGSRVVEGLSAIDYICEHEPDDGRSLQDILREACVRIGDPDAIYGCGSSRLQDRSARVQHYVHLRKWDKVMLAQDIELCSGSGSSIAGLLNALQQSGLQYLLGRFVRTTCNEVEESADDFRYECAWRLCDWDLSTAGRSDDCGNDYHFHHYQALKCLREADDVGSKAALDGARASIVEGLCNASLESSKTVYPWLSQLQMLREIEELSSIAPDEYGEAIARWQRRDFANANDFRYVEPILSQRAVICRMRDSLDALVGVYLNMAKVAEKQGYLQVAARALGTLAKQNDLSRETRDRLDYREALLAWKRDDRDIARVLMRSLIGREDALSPGLRARALRVYGNWMAETKSENPRAVIDRYYRRSISVGTAIGQPTSRDTKNLHDAHASLARFADVQYQHIAAYTKSPQFESMKECAEYSRVAAVKLNSSVKDGDTRRAAVLNQRQSRNDVAELENIEREKNMYLLLALRHYLITLRQSEDHDLLIFRLVSLWLDNMHHRESNELFDDELGQVASFKFIPLVPQLAPHMSDVLDVFSTKIYKLLQACAMEHPHHTLPVLLALTNTYEDHKFYSDKKISARRPQPRVLGAKRLIAQLLKTDIGPIVREMNELAHSLVMLANLELETKGRGVHKIPKSQQILRIDHLKSTLVPTLTINVQPSGKYDDIVGVYKYKETFESVGGLNAPKKITCIGTDGICRNQLVKGKDDLRQDAVMQQVFTVMNSLLGTSKETKKRKLNVRTYKVVPLTQRSGILQWCDNTSPIINILAGSDQVSGVHKRYYPKDYTAQFCKRKMISVATKSNDVKLKTLLDCCEHLHPAFHHFFTENYPSPETWFERRLAYTRSVATTSIIGYILGLGDRHLLNILLDVTTAEVIHIDFGIAFEQGKVLPTPETVPFRLTRDIEVAMGVSGVEGIMRRCCEETMTVLRNQREIIITLLQVLLYDPLFSWAITPAKAHSLQGGDTQGGSSETSQAANETNKLAERALLRIEQKLQGTEEGLASSVAGQVERLIQQARDPANLCRLYYGWQPYL